MATSCGSHMQFENWEDFVKFATDNLMNTVIYPKFDVKNNQFQFSLGVYEQDKSYTYTGPYYENLFDDVGILLKTLKYPHEVLKQKYSITNEERLTFCKWLDLERYVSEHFFDETLFPDYNVNDGIFTFELRVYGQNKVCTYSGPDDGYYTARVDRLLKKLNPPPTWLFAS